MRKLSISVLAVAAFATVAPAGAAEPIVVTGNIMVGNPATRETGGVTEYVSPCGDSISPEVPANSAQGVDGYTIDLLASVNDDYDALQALYGRAASLNAERTIPDVEAVPLGTANDVDAWFYDDGCGLIRKEVEPDAYRMATIGPLENGTIPFGTRFVVIDLARGVDADFTFTVAGE